MPTYFESGETIPLMEFKKRTDMHTYIVLILFLAEGVLNPVNAALDLVVDARDLALEYITVRILARVADFLVAVRAGVDVGFL